MKIKLDRRFKGEDYTISSLFVNDKYFCDCMEDTVRDIGPNGEGKIKGKTAIPKGCYRVLRTPSPRFKRMLPILMNVPHFEGIRIHPGNSPADTEGCLLPGENKVKGKVIHSREWFLKLDALIKEALDKGKKVTCEIS